MRNTEAFPHLLAHLEANGSVLCLGRNQTPLRQLGTTRILSSYGQVLRSDPQFPIEGRIHIDLSSSFMFREGGLDGLYELASVSATRMSDAARKSPGSVISAIQYRVAMEDGVLVPWKKPVQRIQNLLGIYCNPIVVGFTLIVNQVFMRM